MEWCRAFGSTEDGAEEGAEEGAEPAAVQKRVQGLRWCRNVSFWSFEASHAELVSASRPFIRLPVTLRFQLHADN